MASKKRPLFIVLDGILQLHDFYSGPDLKWISQNKNDNVHIIVAVSCDEESALKLAKTAISNKAIPVGFHRIKSIPNNVARQYMIARLLKNKLVLDDIVDGYLAAYAKKNEKYPEMGSFLLMNLVCQRIVDGFWAVEDMPMSLKAAVTSVFSRAESIIGDLIVRRSVGYLASMRVGLSRLEFSNLLTQDSAISVHLRQTYQTPIFYTPPAVVSFILDNLLAPLLTIRKSDGWPLYIFSSVDIKNIAIDRYIRKGDSAASFGREITDYFLSVSANQPRYVESLKRYERVYVCRQSVSFVPEKKWYLPGATERPNYRRVDELPYVVVTALQKGFSMDAVKGECYINYEFLLAACAARGLAYVLDIYNWLNDLRPEPDEELVLVNECLKLSRLVLQRDISQLGSQLCGRLAGPISRDKPVAPGDPPKLINVRNMARAICTTGCSIVTNGAALMAPCKSSYYELNGGHRQPLTAMAVADDSSLLLTAGQDDKMILWNLKLGGRIIRLIHDVGANVTQLFMARMNQLALVIEPHLFRAWNLETAECVHVFQQGFIEPLIATLLKNGSIVASCYCNSGKVTVWNLAEGDLGIIRNAYDLSKYFDPKLNSLTASVLLPLNTATDSLLLASVYRSNFAIVFNVDSGKMAAKLETAHTFGIIQAIGRSEDVFILTYEAYEENNRSVITLIDLFLAYEKHQRIRTISGCRFDGISTIFVNSNGTHAISILKNRKTSTSHFMVWNLDTEDHKHLGTHTGVSDLMAMSSLNCICTSGKDNSRILIWNMAAEVTKRIPKYRPKNYVIEIQRMQSISHYAVTRTSDNGPLAVWNCFLGRCAGKSVRIEHGITETADVILVRNTRLLVLTEVKPMPVSSDSSVRSHIFSAFRLYDIHRRVLIRRVVDCIVPFGNAEDFVYFEVNRFMGLSESRTEFVIWDVETGFQLMRIKPSFDDELEMLDPIMAKIRGRRKSVVRVSTSHRRYLDHLQAEYRNPIHSFIVSDDLSTIVTCHYSHFLCVIESSQHSLFRHSQTLTEPDSIMLLTVCALSPNGHYCAIYTYDDAKKTTCVTAWKAREGKKIRRMAGQSSVGALAISREGDHVLIGKENGELRVWDPRYHGSERVIPGYPGCSFQPGSSKIWLSDDNTIAFCLTNEISAWDITNGTVLAVFTPDIAVQCMNVSLGGKVAVFGTSESSNLITLKLSKLDYSEISMSGQDAANIFGELRDPFDFDDNELEEGL